MESPVQSTTAPRKATLNKEIPIQFLALALLLLIAGYFRFTGLLWGDYQYQHPDERFLIWVVADISPVHSLAQYFDTAASTLNPANRGHTFYVYGDFPVILTRYATEAFFHQAGWQEILQMGRGLSALLDLLTVLLVYLAAERLSGWKVATVAGAFSAAAVLQIQQAHFFTSDSFALFFTMLAIYLAVLIVTTDSVPIRGFPRRLLGLGLLFGVAVGMAMACKINTAPVAVLLPAALAFRWARSTRDLDKNGSAADHDEIVKVDSSVVSYASLDPYEEEEGLASDPESGNPDPASTAMEESPSPKPGMAFLDPYWKWIIIAAVSGVVAFLVFRLAMPYAFTGPRFTGIGIDPRWLSSIKELQAQSTGDVDFPPALQWAKRNHLFSFQNLTLWGLGIPLSIAAWAGFLLFAWRALQRVLSPAADSSWLGRAYSLVSDPRFAGGLLVWLWTGAYFLWQSMSWNPTMRYQLPIYPTLCILAAWGLGELVRNPIGFGVRGSIFQRKTAGMETRPTRDPGNPASSTAWRVGVYAAGALALVLTLAWAFAFTRIYNRTETRVAATHWIYANVPGPVNLQGATADGQPWNQIVPVNEQVVLRSGSAYLVRFLSGSGGALVSIDLPATNVASIGAGDMLLRGRIFDAAQPDVTLAEAQIALPASGGFDKLELPVTSSTALEAGKTYSLALELVAPPAGQTGAALSTGTVVQINGGLTLNLYARSHTANYQGQEGSQSELMLAQGGTLRQIRFPAGSNRVGASVVLRNPQTGEQWAAMAAYQGQPAAADANTIVPLKLDPPLEIKPGVSYLISIASQVPGQPVSDAQAIELDFEDEPSALLLPGSTQLARPEEPLWAIFTAGQDASLTKLSLGHVVQEDATVKDTDLLVQVYDRRNPNQVLRAAHATVAPAPANDPRGGALEVTISPPLALAKDNVYNISLIPSAGAVAVRGSAPVNETDWDMGLPFRMDNYDPFGGIYRNDLNIQAYWDDNPDKLQRLIGALDQGDYVFMSSNRQWGTTTRVPERYPLTTAFYRDLLGCPPERSVVWCYNVAEPGMFHGNLGFDLVQVFTSYPSLGPLRFNTQFAEEAFTVYDAPKVMLFQKRADYSPANTRAVLGAVDLRNVVHVTPRKAGSFKDLLLTPAMRARQVAGGTWAALFPPDGLLNRYPGLAMVVFYLFLFLLGALVYPILRLALPALPDRAYPLARTAGVVLFAYLAWISGSAGVSVTRGLLLAVFLALAAAGIILGFLQRNELREEWRARRNYFLVVEGVALALFAIDLLIRLGNPDLWHPIFGGEKPMDFSFFNAVLKSSVFPPYDPWFGGGYINYYYYGFVLVGMPVKLLGINPSVAYNLVLPGLFLMVGLGAFSIGWNLLHGRERGEPEPEKTPQFNGAGLTGRPSLKTGAIAGVIAVLALLILGNLGTVRMYWQGFQKRVVSDQQMAQGNMFQHIGWASQGVVDMLKSESKAFPYYPGDWYWKPSRAIEPESGNEITEFPMFTFLYADLHAHLMALPVTLLVLGWALGMVLGRGRWGLADGRWKALSFGLALLVGALAAGALRPANTWDQYTYLALAAIALFYGLYRREDAPGRWWLNARWLRALVPALLLAGLAVLFYRPFDAWFAQGYNSLEAWKGATTNVASYLTHWGLFLFVIAAWLFDETVDWMDRTPLSALNALRGARQILLGGAVLLVFAIIVLLAIGVHIAFIAVALGVWVTVLLFRPGQPAMKRAALFMVGVALALTLGVELVAVKGDIGRMNTVFKFYYQAWTLLSLSAAAALAWLWTRLPTWNTAARRTWLTLLGLLVFGAALFPLTATRAKVTDRMDSLAPHTLDGMGYMQVARYNDGQTPETSTDLDLSADYRAILWARANIPGSPVIVEANTPEYRHWGTRFTIYTGLPGVVGWNWHERQQRTITPDTWVYDRIGDVGDFYMTESPTQAATFLQRYHVQYIIVGQLERTWYGPKSAGIQKFAKLDGTLWDKVYADGDTLIYKVK